MMEGRNGFDAGHIFEGPNGERCELMSDIRPGVVMNWTFLKPLDGMPEITKRGRLPLWLYPMFFLCGRVSYER